MSDDTDRCPEAVNRFDWERRLLSAELPGHLKLMGLTLAVYANRDGTNAHPGVAHLMADCSILSDKTVRKHLADLAQRGWITRTFHGSNAGRQALADVYSLTSPMPAARKWSREEHRYFDLPSPVNGSLNTGSPDYRPPSTSHHDDAHHSASRPLAQKASQADDDMEDLLDRLDAWAVATYGRGLDIGNEQRARGMDEQGVPWKVIENTIRRDIREYESVWTDDDSYGTSDAPF